MSRFNGAARRHHTIAQRDATARDKRARILHNQDRSIAAPLRSDARNSQSAGVSCPSNGAAQAQIPGHPADLPGPRITTVWPQAPIAVRATKQETSHVQEYSDRARRCGRPRDGARLRELRAADPAGMAARIRKFKVGQALRWRRRERRERLSFLDGVSPPIACDWSLDRSFPRMRFRGDERRVTPCPTPRARW